MEELFIRIGELIATELEEVVDVEYLPKEVGYMLYVNLTDGKKLLLSLIDSTL